MKTLALFPLCSLASLIVGASPLQAQTQIFWEAYNDHRPSDLTHENVSDYDLRTTDDGGPLRDFATGGELNASVIVVVEDGLTPDDFGANNPVDEGSPADLLFGGKVDIGNAGLPGLRDSNAIKLTLVFQGLDPNKRYNFRGTVSRGNNYDDRWSVFGITGDDGHEDAHVDGSDRQNIFTEATFADGDLEDNEVALNSGHNTEGSLVGWDNIEPGDDGEFSIDSRQYVGEAPFGDPVAGPYGYGFNAIYLAEVAPAGEAALIIEEELAGNHGFDGALGMDFVANLPIQVFQLGAFDSGSDGLELPITLELWSRNDGGTPDDFTDDTGGEILASLVIEADEGNLEGGTRFLPLEEPIVLKPGAYTIVSWGYGGAEPNYRVEGQDAAAQGLTMVESDFITFVGKARFGAVGNNGQFPATLDIGPANRYGAGNFKFGSTGDSDGDGLPDDWEELYGFDIADAADAEADLDGDGLTNLKEFERDTDPTKVDSDGDGLNDNVETGTGIYIDAGNTGTSPIKDDSDSDGLKDKVETNTKTFVSVTDTGTDPNKRDSDGDGVGDGTEVASGFDPNNRESVPTVIKGGGVFATTHVWTEEDLALDLVTAEEITLDPQDYETITVDTKYIHFDDNGAPPIFLDQSEPFPLWGPEGNDEGRGDRNDFAIRSVGQINITQSGTITFVCNSDDGFVLRIDGNAVGEAGNRGRTNSFMEADLAAGVHDLEFIYYERGGGAGVSLFVFRSIGEAPQSLNESEWQLLEATGGGSAPFQIETVVLAGEKLTFTWPSAPGQSFVLEQSTDLVEWEEVTDGYPSGGETTSFEFELGAAPPAVLYVRVREE